MSKIQITPKYADVKPKGFYVYLHTRGDNNSIFYVGRGNTNRGWQAYSGYRSDWWRSVASKGIVTVDIAQDGLTTEQADLLEEWLIAKLRHEGVNLVNITEGGGGTVGWIPSDETKEKIGLAHRKAINNSDGMRFESVKLAADWMRVNGHPTASQGHLSSAAIGTINQAYGRAWWFDGDDPKEYVSRSETFRKSRGKMIFRSDGLEHASLVAAVEHLRGTSHATASIGNVSVAARRGRIAYGYSWSYV